MIVGEYLRLGLKPFYSKMKKFFSTNLYTKLRNLLLYGNFVFKANKAFFGWLSYSGLTGSRTYETHHITYFSIRQIIPLDYLFQKESFLNISGSLEDNTYLFLLENFYMPYSGANAVVCGECLYFVE